MNTKTVIILSHFIVLMLILISCQSTDSNSSSLCKKDEISSPFLLSISEAKNRIEQDSTIIVVEVSKEAEYNKGHLPNALHIWRPDFRSKQDSPVTGMRCSPEEFVIFLQNLGLDKASNLIVYDAKGGSDASRLAWVFDYYGFENYKVINGGKKAWTLAGHVLDTNQVMAERNANYTFDVRENQDILASHSEVWNAIKDPQTIIIDTREQYEHEGQCFVHQGKVLSHKKGAYARGCIPTSIHLNWSKLSDLSGDHRIKCIKDLEYDLGNKSITKDKNIIVYCQSGSRSSHTAFVLKKILGYPNVKNYDGSWIEWSHLASTDETYPIHLHVSEEGFSKELNKRKLELQHNAINTTK